MAIRTSASKRDDDARNSQAIADQQGIENRTGKNHLWLSQGFIRKYWHDQTGKFAVTDQAFAQAVATDKPVMQPRAALSG